MQKNLWKGLFRPENKKLRSNIFLALLVGVLLLAMGKGFFGGEKETPAQAETQTASDAAERETETRMAEILSKVQGARCGGCHADLLQDGGTHHCTG